MKINLWYNISICHKENICQGTEGSAPHILAQTLVAAATASLAGNDPLTAGLSAGGAEIIAPKLAEWLYGIDPNDPEAIQNITSEQKNTISAIISLGSAAIGTTTSNVTDVVSSSVAGTTAVEDNSQMYLPHPTTQPNQNVADAYKYLLESGKLEYNKYNFDKLYLLNTNPNMEVKIDATGWTILQTTEFVSPTHPEKFPPGTLIASGKIPYSDFDRWSVNGSVAIIKYPDGSIVISDIYNYDLKPNISSTLRNIETYLGNPNTPTNNGIEFKFSFTGEFKLQEDY